MRALVLPTIAAALVAQAALIPAAGADPIKIDLVSRTVFFAPAWVAEKKGYFKSEGIEPKLEIVGNLEKINEEVRSGEAKIGLTSFDALVSNAFKGGNLRIVASLAQKPPHFIIAQPRIKTLADLRGARFGTVSMQEGTTFLIYDLLRAIGLKPEDVVIEAVGGAPRRWELLQQGKIDVGLQPFPLSYESEAKGFTNLGAIAKYVSDFEFTGGIVDPAWASANRQTLVGFLRAMRRGQADMIAEPDAAAALIAPELHTSVANARRAIDDALTLKIMPDGLVPSEAGMRRVFASQQAAGLVPKDATFDMRRFVDLSYLDAAK